jgi:protein-S-isoprenylcysteine O-methyltransferase Ste14
MECMKAPRTRARRPSDRGRSGSQLRPEPKRESSPRARFLDQFERILLVIFYAWLLERFIPAFLETRLVDHLLFLISEGMAVCFLLLRRPAQRMGTSFTQWAVAAGATLSVLLVSPSDAAPLGPREFGRILLLAGAGWQFYAKFTLGRSFGMVAANRGLTLGGPYRIVRHPMYAGYLLCHSGFLFLNPTLHNVVIYTIFYSLQVPRIFIEEELLSREQEYQKYQAAVRYRLIPGLF